uniref:Uncharacterized protein n=1 Tax=Trypanosoma congolense (strain IL3000) TaxID=1068625 RepID=G0URE1_TRYCI|nr:conserved hypothetical protein [Trypanosoma congolense IL3000]
MSICGEINRTAPLGLFGLDQCGWRGSAGFVWEFWKLAPCCGAPDFANGILCFLNCLFCLPCILCKTYASSLDDVCSIWPHCFMVLLCPCLRWFTRYNLRKRNGTDGNIIGDFFCVFCCCAPCAMCQEYRSIEMARWRIVPEPSRLQFFTPGCRLLR